MSLLTIAGVLVAGACVFIVLRGPTYRGRERRLSGPGGR